MRAMILHHPDDRNTWRIETQYYLGEDLLIAPILQPLDEMENHMVYFPQGRWYDFWTKGELKSPGQWFSLGKAPLGSMPIWVREGARIALAAARTRTFNHVGEIEKIEHYGSTGG